MKIYYDKETGKRVALELIDIWDTIFVKLCSDKAQYSLPHIAFRLGLLASQGRLIYTARIEEMMERTVSPSTQRILDVARETEKEFFDVNFELPIVMNMVDEYMHENFLTMMVH
jgi:hypothetical protein